MPKNKITRRSAMRITGAGVLSVPAAAGALHTMIGEKAMASESKLKGNINQSVSKWCYNGFIEKNSYDEFAKQCAEMGLVGIDLIGPGEWATAQKYGLVPTMVPGAGSINNGLNDKKNHKKCLEDFKENIKNAAGNKCPNVITFSGSRRSMSDVQAWDNCEAILKEAVKVAEDCGVVINMELLNSKVDHADYQCDRTEWGVELCKRVGSPNFKLLYDIYHMQIMEGDVIRTIRDYHPYIGHYHTGGNPGRNEIDTTQELYYPAIMEAIVETGFKGYVAHEFVPKRDPMTSLKEAVAICDV